MLLDDIIYITLLCLSVAIGPLIRNVPNKYFRRLFSTVAGILIVLIVSGKHIIHPLFVTFVNALIVLLVNKRLCHILSAAFCFGYLTFFRSMHFLGFPAPPAHTNAIQMILTLKMVGLAFEIKTIEESEKTDDVATLNKYRRVKPSFLDIFHYAFCIAGVLIGPYYKYRTYWDMLHRPYSTSVSANIFLKKRIKVVPLYISLYLVGNFLYPIEYASSNEILEKSFWYRAFYMTPSFFNFRMRIYAGFILGECVCIAMGLGAYPAASNPQPGAGPTNYAALEEMEKTTHNWVIVPYSFETVKNIYEYGSEFWPTIREGIRSWNRTVQYWLASFVYKRLSASKPTKIAFTMLVSSFWHGVHPGYYLCLCSAPLFLLAEVEVEKAFKHSASYPQQVVFDWLWWLIKMQSFAYMGMPFLLLDISSSLKFWQSVYFCGHIFIVAIYAVAKWVNNRKKKKLI